MKRISYNISDQKKINIAKTVFPMVFLILIALFLLVTGINNIISTNTRLSDKINKRNFYRNETEKMEKKIGEIDKKIDQVYLKWNSKVKFVNTAIKLRIRSNPEVLDFLEEILPKSVAIYEISISNSIEGIVNMSVISDSTEQLYKFYKNLVGYDLIILSENEYENVYKAKVRIKFKNEKN